MHERPAVVTLRNPFRNVASSRPMTETMADGATVICGRRASDLAALGASWKYCSSTEHLITPLINLSTRPRPRPPTHRSPSAGNSHHAAADGSPPDAPCTGWAMNGWVICYSAHVSAGRHAPTLVCDCWPPMDALATGLSMTNRRRILVTSGVIVISPSVRTVSDRATRRKGGLCVESCSVDRPPVTFHPSLQVARFDR
ncbi:unnamed protein product [Soboliphyme baturini]|uniref:Uncharacterized protein n=1 Tax=Soboliphyme baturini TaxID=241478 RepID=A0A183IPC6_9BILA|nr:unnamed protein product [Soboliphyme baturini]